MAKSEIKSIDNNWTGPNFPQIKVSRLIRASRTIGAKGIKFLQEVASFRKQV